jgi:aquaporin NIP
MNIKKYFPEFLGTFTLVFLGTGSIIFSEEYKGSFTVFTIALVFGITVGFLIYFLGKFSDCHINPCVTLTFIIYKEIPLKRGIIYIFIQIIGAILASLCWRIMFPNNQNLGNTLPSVPIIYAFILEFVMSGLLILGILYSRIQLPRFIHFVVGIIVFIEAWLGGPFTGASMNTARTIGPVIVSRNYSNLWLYSIAPTTGMIVFYFLFAKTMQKKIKKAFNTNIITFFLLIFL